MMATSDNQKQSTDPTRDGPKRRRVRWVDLEFVDGVIKALQEYEQQPEIEPVDQGTVEPCLMGLADRLPGKTLSLPCRKLWYAMAESSRQGSPDARQFAGELIEQLKDEFFNDGRLVVFLDDCSLILDRELYAGFEPHGLSILNFLAEHQGKPFTAEQLAKDVLGSARYVTKVRDGIKKLEEKLNYRSKESGERKRGRKPKVPPIKLIHSRTGYGYWFELPRR